MIGTKKLSTIRDELRAAYAAEGANPIASLDRKLRKLEKARPAGKISRSLVLLRNALSQLVVGKPQKPVLPLRSKRTKKAV